MTTRVVSDEDKNGLQKGEVDVNIKGKVTDSRNYDQRFGLYFSRDENPDTSSEMPYFITVQFDANAETANNLDIKCKSPRIKNDELLHLDSTIIQKDKDFEIRLGVLPDKIVVNGIAEERQTTGRPCSFSDAKYFVAAGEGLTISSFSIDPRLLE